MRSGAGSTTDADAISVPESSITEVRTPDVPMSKIVSHQKWQKYLFEVGNKPGMRVLEIGAREVSCASNARKEFAKAEYVGFDYYPGDNVDIVGDAHKLCSYFKDGEQFKEDKRDKWF